MEWFADTVVKKMENRLKLYLVFVPKTDETAYISYHDVIGFIVACYSETEARNTNPQEAIGLGWVMKKDVHLLDVRLIGYASEDVQPGEIIIKDVLEV